uniref:Trigger_C domain-containing protein n=1 Tax=Caenorhabditis tropicalis TaxID=1561998 RepID=A0A1I7T531_9PELO
MRPQPLHSHTGPPYRHSREETHTVIHQPPSFSCWEVSQSINMSNAFVDEKSIVAQVDKELKKCGTFDKIRKQVTEHINASPLVERLETEMLAKVNELMESSSNMSKEEIQRKMRDYIGNNFKMRNDINRQTRIELEKDWVKETLVPEIEEKVNKQLEDSV